MCSLYFCEKIPSEIQFNGDNILKQEGFYSNYLFWIR